VRVFVRTRAPLVNTHLSTHKRAATNRLWRYRKERQLSQRHIARLLGHRTGAQVSRWESGKKVPTLDNALLLACVLDTPVESLFAERAAELRARISTRTSKRDGA
jgi:transcriptional regulator with XRE-family HTH domain